MSEIRLAVERALSKLINRFGPMSDVIHELEFAVTELKKQEAGASAPVAPTEAPATGAEPEAEQKAGDTPGSKPKGRSVKRGNK